MVLHYLYSGRKHHHPRVQYQEQYKKSPYRDNVTPNNRPSIQVFNNRRRPYISNYNPEVHRKGQYETRKRTRHPNKMSDSGKNHATSKLNKNENRYDKSRYAEYEIGESSNSKEQDYHLYESSFSNEKNNDDNEYFDDFTPYIQEDNGLKIPVLPAPNPSKHK